MKTINELMKRESERIELENDIKEMEHLLSDCKEEVDELTNNINVFKRMLDDYSHEKEFELIKEYKQEIMVVFESFLEEIYEILVKGDIKCKYCIDELIEDGISELEYEIRSMFRYTIDKAIGRGICKLVD